MENNNYCAYRNEQWIVKSYFKVINKENSSASNTKSKPKASNYIRKNFSTVNFLSEGFHLI